MDVVDYEALRLWVGNLEEVQELLTVGVNDW